jgi:hypothetical protein
VSESVILCEGYHDRAFWSGLLEYAGCTNPAVAGGSFGPIKVRDPFGNTVAGGQYAFQSRSGRFLRVVPCHGRDRILGIARTRLAERTTKSLLRLVLNVDPDTQAGNPAAPGGATTQTLEQIARDFDPAVVRTPLGVAIDGGDTELSLVRWECHDAPAPGTPDQQTLERLVCCSLCAAYPDRAAAVQHWLDHRPAPPASGAKEYVWSHMAGWFAENGCDTFYSLLWRDPRLAAELEVRLRASGAWAIVEALAV